MTTTSNLDTITATLEHAVKLLQGDAPPTRKRMRLSEFMTFTLSEIQKAAKDKPEQAKRRLTTLKHNVDEVISVIAKLAVEDIDGSDIDIEVTTAFAPTKADGDVPMADLTTASDQSSTEETLERVAAAGGDSTFAVNLDQVAKALRKLQQELGSPDDDKSRTRATKSEPDGTGDDGGGAARRGSGRDEGSDRDADGWPLDLATDAFLEGTSKDGTTPLWGFDPDEVASPKAR
jgi:hypothetical protein